MITRKHERLLFWHQSKNCACWLLQLSFGKATRSPCISASHPVQMASEELRNPHSVGRKVIAAKSGLFLNRSEERIEAEAGIRPWYCRA